MSPRLTPEQLPDDSAVSPSTRPRWDSERWHVFPVGLDKAPLVRWKTSATNDPTMVAIWQARYPNSNVGIACGPSGLLVMDADAPGEFERFCEAHGQPVPRTFSVSTAKGRHWYFRRDRDISNAVRLPGFELDVRAVGGYVVAPGSVHQTGVVYEPVEPSAPILAAPEWLFEALASRATPRGTEVPRANLAPASLDALLANPQERGSGQTNDWLARVAGHLATQHRGDRTGYYAAVSDAVARVDPEYEDTQKVADSVWSKDQRDHPGEKASKSGKKSPLAQVLSFLRTAYEFSATPAGEVFAVPVDGPRRPLTMTENGSATLRARVTSAMFHQTQRAPAPATVDEALRIVHSDAYLGEARLELSLRLARTPEGLVLDLAQPGNSRCAIVTRRGWTVADEPPAGVLFRLTRTTKPLPEPERGGSLDPLLGDLGWHAEDPRWALIRGWLVASCFPDIHRPLLAFTGQPGSGKTSRARLVLSVIDPREELGSSFGKNEGDEQAMAAGRYLVGWDNISKVSDEVSDRLCRLVTGEESVRRKLYTDSDQAVVSYRRTGAITAVVQPSLRADALERLIPVSCDRIESVDRESESGLRRRFAEGHGAVLGGLLDALVRTLENLPVSRARRGVHRVRMADFHDVLHAFDPAIADVYAASTERVMVDAAEADPFLAAVSDWLRDEFVFPLRIGTEEARQAAERRLPVSESGQRPWWPSAPSRFLSLLERNAEPLHALGFRVERLPRTKHGRPLLFTKIGASVQPELPGVEQ